MDWDTLAYNIDETETIISLFLVLISFFIFRLNSVTVTLFCWVIGNFIMELTMKGLILFRDDYLILVRHLQYLIWMCFHALMLMGIFKFHQSAKLEISKYSYFVATTIVLLSLMQLLRFVDRLILGTDVLADVYRYGVLSLNLGPALLAAPIVCPSFFNILKRSANKLLS